MYSLTERILMKVFSVYNNSNIPKKVNLKNNQITYSSKIPFKSNEESELKVKGPSLYNGFDGSIKGNFNGISVDFDIDKKIITILDKERLAGTYKIDDETKKCDLNFKQKFNIAHKYQINGVFGDKNVNILFATPLIKHSNVTGTYNSNAINLHINRNLSNIIRNDYKLTGEFNNKNVDLHCKGLFFFGGHIEGTFNGKPVNISTNQKLNPFVDKRKMLLDFNLDNEDKEDFLFLNTIMTINDLYLRN